MLYLIYGENASGKTKYLMDVVYSAESIVTNIEGVLNTFEEYDDSKVQLLAEMLACDVVITESGLVFDNPVFPVRESVMWLVRLFCTKGSVMVLDEPESKLSSEYQNEVYNIIKELYTGFKDVYVATHAGNLSMFEGAEVVTVIDGELVPLERRVAYEQSL